MMNIQLLSCSIRTTPVQNGLSAAMSAIPMAQMVTEAVRPAVCGCEGGHIQCKWEQKIIITFLIIIHKCCAC